MKTTEEIASDIAFHTLKHINGVKYLYSRTIEDAVTYTAYKMDCLDNKEAQIMAIGKVKEALKVLQNVG